MAVAVFAANVTVLAPSLLAATTSPVSATVTCTVSGCVMSPPMRVRVNSADSPLRTPLPAAMLTSGSTAVSTSIVKTAGLFDGTFLRAVYLLLANGRILPAGSVTVRVPRKLVFGLIRNVPVVSELAAWPP